MKKRQRKNWGRRLPKEVHIEAMAPQGWGISGKGRDRIYVWGGLLGDHVRLANFKHYPRRVEATIREVVQRRVDGVAPECDHFEVCGGCLWQHVPYEHQLLMKQEIVKTCFSQARLDTTQIKPVIGSPNPLFYRNKNDFTFGFGEDPALGFFESEVKISGGTRRPERGRVPSVFNVDSCALQTDLADMILKHVRDAVMSAGVSFYHPGTRRGTLRSLVLRQSNASGDVLVHFVAAKPCEEELAPIAKDLIQCHSKIKGVVLSINNKRSKNAAPMSQLVLAGQDSVVEEILGLRIRVSPASFLQVNTPQAETLYQVVLDFAGLCKADRVIDLYCGTGSLSLLLAQHSQGVVGIEVVESAVNDAAENAKANGIENCRFLCGDVADILPEYIAEEQMANVITVNPPRGGVHKGVIKAICDTSPERIVYVSCNAETLARDLVLFNRGGYGVKGVQPVDMFPQTPHVEIVVKLEPKTR